MKPLTPRQLRFVEEYLVDFNGAAAAKRAGYAGGSAARQAHALRNTPHVAAAIEAGRRARSAEVSVTAERVLTELSRIGFADPARMLGADGAILALGDMPPEVMAAVKVEVRVKPPSKGAGEPASEYVIRPLDKARALTEMAKHLGMFDRKGRKHEAAEAVQAAADAPPVWSPLAGPQTLAYESAADVTGYGGAAGGGKTDLALGLALTRHRTSAIFRRESTQLSGIIDRLGALNGGRAGYNGAERVWRFSGRQIEFGSAPHPGDERRYQGRPKDLLVLDEATGLLEAQARFLMGWVRTTMPGQRCRTVMTFNPPAGAEGRWVIDYFAPWLDPGHARPAQPGELRWFASVDGRDVELADGRAYVIEDGAPVQDFDAAAFRGDQIMRPQSRTFIPSKVSDNPYLATSGYVATLQALPEPLRSQMLDGDFSAGMEDDQWQVIPSAWVDAAMARWREGAGGAAMDSMGIDVARGGRDQTVIARRHGAWFDRLICLAGEQTPDGPTLAGQVIVCRRDRAVAHVDVVGWGASPYDVLAGNGVQAVAVNGAARASGRTREAGLAFVNLRAEIWWRMREALDPHAEPALALPPDAALKADLCAPRWRQAVGGVQIEAKADVMARIGRSPDRGDAVCMALMTTPKTAERRARTMPAGSWMG